MHTYLTFNLNVIFISVPPVLPLGLYLLPSESAELELRQNAEQELFNFSVMLHFFFLFPLCSRKVP